MDDRTPAAEERLAEFFLMPLFEREAAWAEIADEIAMADEVERRWRPAPRTMRGTILGTRWLGALNP